MKPPCLSNTKTNVNLEWRFHTTKILNYLRMKHEILTVRFYRRERGGFAAGRLDDHPLRLFAISSFAFSAVNLAYLKHQCKNRFPPRIRGNFDESAMHFHDFAGEAQSYA